MTKKIVKPVQPVYRGIGVLVITHDYSNGAVQITHSNLDANAMWTAAKGAMDAAHAMAVAKSVESSQ